MPSSFPPLCFDISATRERLVRGESGFHEGGGRQAVAVQWRNLSKNEVQRRKWNREMRQQKLRFFKRLGFLVLAYSAAVAMGAPLARPVDLTGAPPALQVWRDWALFQQEFRQCPLLVGAAGVDAEDFLCTWPGLLALDVNDEGAIFAQDWKLAADAWVSLPGDSRDWPQGLTVNGTPHPTLLRDGTPALWLKSGEHRVRGRILWQERPQALSIPAASALVSLRIDGKLVQPLQRQNNRLTLGRSAAIANEAADSMELQIYRKLTDSIPAQLVTHIQLQVSGKPREVRVAPALPEHFIATALETPWPARLDAEGHLQIQVQPGQATLVLNARATKPLQQLKARLPETLAQEVWSYEAVPSLRTAAVVPEGDAMAVDPKQAGVPSPWHALPAFAMSESSGLAMEERSRGLSMDEANRLTLSRKMWLDFSGEGYFARDNIRGRMQQGWRFDVAMPHQLQRADARGEPLLVTKGIPEEGATRGWTGIEWRSPEVALNASLRVAAGPSSALPVTGWQQTFDFVEMVLHLPYGYKLLAAPGADAANDSWIARWTILDIFFAAFIALLAWRLLGFGGGLVAAAYLLLAFKELQAPLWTLAVVLVLGLLSRALPDGWVGKILRFIQRVALAIFFLMAAVFVPAQLRAALHPQLEPSDNGYSYGYQGHQSYEANALEAEERMAVVKMLDDAPEPAESASVARKSFGSAPPPPPSSRPKAALRYAQSNVVQTGMAEPNWDIGQHYNLRWTGPVLATQSVRFIISPPWLTRLLRLAMVVLLGLILWRVTRGALLRKLKPATAQGKPGAATVAMCMLVGAACLHPSSALAQEAAAFPPQELLQTLQERLNQPPRCAPECAGIALADIHAKDSLLRVRLEAHAGDSVALPLPVAEDNTVLLRVRVNGRLVDAVHSHNERGHVALPHGVHSVELDYAALGGDTSLHFSVRPSRVVFSGQGWRADGIDEDRLINETLHLSRVVAETPNAAERVKEGGAQQFPAYMRVVRALRFDLDWTVKTVVTRISPREGGLTLTLPLLSGEHVTTPGIKVQGEEATVSLGHTEFQTQWDSRLNKRETLQLVAPALTERTEVWRVELSPSWHIDWEGVPVTLLDVGGEAMFEFHPLPGETLTLTLTSPSVVEGRLRAVDSAHLSHAIGVRASQHTLSFRLRASQGGEHAIVLPSSDMEVLSVQRNGESLNLRPRDGKLTLPVLPGEQTFLVSLRELREMDTLITMPAFNLGLPTANIELKAELPEQRWLLAAFGPSVGPAVLYWGELAVALVLALLLTLFLARHGGSALRFHHWFLLVLGFSTFSWVALAVVAFWLIALDWRRRAGAMLHWRVLSFYAVQFGLMLLTVVALVCLVAVIPKSLLGMPDMGVIGHGSFGNRLLWFADQSEGALPTVTLLSLPLWVYRVTMLLWALWLAQAVIGWLRRGFAAWKQGGLRWKVQVGPTPPAAPSAVDEASTTNKKT